MATSDTTTPKTRRKVSIGSPQPPRPHDPGSGSGHGIGSSSISPPTQGEIDLSAVNRYEERVEEHDKARIALIPNMGETAKLILHGIDYMEEFDLGYDTCNEKGEKIPVKVKIRPLSDFELDMAVYSALERTSKKYDIGPLLSKKTINANTDPINTMAWLLATTHENIEVALTSMRTFYPDITRKDVEGIVGLKGMAARIRELSGISQGSNERASFFLGDQRGSSAGNGDNTGKAPMVESG